MGLQNRNLWAFINELIYYERSLTQKLLLLVAWKWSYKLHVLSNLLSITKAFCYDYENTF